MAFNQNSFINFSNNDIIEFINTINQGLNENIPISRERGSHRRNIRTLCTYLNQHNAQQIINPNFNDNDFDENLDQFIIHEQNKRKYEQSYQDSLNNESINEDELNEIYTQYYNKQHELNKSYEQNYQDILNRETFYEDEQPNESDIEYYNEQQNQFNRDFTNEQNYNNNITNRESFYDDELDEQNVQYFERQAEIENAIKRAYEAVDNAINLINKSKPNLKKVEPKLIKDKSHLLEYYVPENEELYEYLDKFNHKFISKNNDFLIINEPHDLDKAVETLNKYDLRMQDSGKACENRPESNIVEKSNNGSPIVIYYFNQISSLNDIFESLKQVFDNELKPFKIHFQLSGVFESPKPNFNDNEENEYEYEAREIKWRNYRESIPIIVNSIQDLDYVKMYIESNLHSYETTSSSAKLTIVSSISFTVSRMRKVTGHIKDLPEEFIKNDFIRCFISFRNRMEGLLEFE